MFTLREVLDAYDTAPTPILREALRRWISQILAHQHHALAHDKPDAETLFRAETIFWQTTGAIVNTLLHPEKAP